MNRYDGSVCRGQRGYGPHGIDLHDDEADRIAMANRRESQPFILQAVKVPIGDVVPRPQAEQVRKRFPAPDHARDDFDTLVEIPSGLKLNDRNVLQSPTGRQ